MPNALRLLTTIEQDDPETAQAALVELVEDSLAGGSRDGCRALADFLDASSTGMLLRAARDVIVSASRGANGDHAIRVWDAVTGEPLRALGSTGGVTTMTLGRIGDRDVIITGGGRNREYLVQARDITTGDPIGPPMSGHTKVITAVASGHVYDRDVIMSASDDNTVRIWNRTTGAITYVIDTLDPVRALAVEGDHIALAAGTAVCAISLT
jgi:WD40 repeat protein